MCFAPKPMNGAGLPVNTKTPHCGSRMLQFGSFAEALIWWLDWTNEGEVQRLMRKKGTVHRKGKKTPRWRLFAYAGLIAFCGSAPLGWNLQATAGETSSHAVRALVQRGSKGAGIDEETGDAKRFAERLKHHQRRHFTKQRRDFRKLQARLESQRRLRRARLKARQFAAARRHAAQHAHKHK